MKKFLCDERLWVRWLALSSVAAFLFTAAWVVSYALLPEGILRGRTVASGLAGETAAATFFAEWGRIFVVNLVMGSLILAANRVPRINGYPLGYLIPLLWSVLYGVTVGTNSFALPLAQPLAPSLAILARSGPYEILAYILAAVATAGWPTYAIQRLFVTNPTPVVPRPPLSLPHPERLGLLVAIVALALANAGEAYAILNL